MPGRRLGSRDRRVVQRRVAVVLLGVSVRMRVGMGAVSGHSLWGVVDVGVRAEAARGVGWVPLHVGQLLVLDLHGRGHHVKHDDRRTHGLAEHVLSSVRRQTREWT